MSTYGHKASDKVHKAMHEMKEGTLKSGKSGKRVTSRQQAVAIGLSEARHEGGKVPAKKSAARKTTARKTTSRKTASRKTSH
jgi:topoisomerase IA-like protein